MGVLHVSLSELIFWRSSHAQHAAARLFHDVTTVVAHGILLKKEPSFTESDFMLVESPHNGHGY